MKRVLILAAGLGLAMTGSSQNKILDSLLNALEHYEREDTLKVHTLTDISYYTSENNPKKAKEYAEEALALAKKLNFRRGAANAYRSIAQAYWNQLDNVNCIRFALLALEEYEFCNVPRGINACYSMIAASYSLNMDLDRALQYYKLSYQYGKKINNKAARGGHLNNIGSIYEKKGNYDSALWYYQAALKAWADNNDELRIPIGLSCLGNGYKNLKDYELATYYLQKALPLAIKVENITLTASIYQNLGDIYCKTGRFEQSEAYLMNAIHLIKGTGGYARSYEPLYESLIELETTRKNYEAAFHHLKNLMALKDSLYKEDRSKQVYELETRYETEKKEQTIRLLEQEKRADATVRNSLVVGVLLTILAAFFIYRLQQSRTRKTRQLLGVQRVLNDKLKEVDKLKSRFFANISHEFRTPLTLILSPLDLALRKDTFPALEKEQLTLVKRNANRLLDLVSQLLDLSKLEAGKIELQVKPGNAESFFKMLASSFDSWAQHKQIDFIKNIRIEGSYLWFDQDKAEKIVTNLLANAFKFTPAGGIVTLTVSTLRRSNGNMLFITIADTGKGIPAEEQEQVFLPFYQTKQTTENYQGGTGLGLSLVKELIKVYKGTIRLESKVSGGTTFFVELPADEAMFVPEEMEEAYPAFLQEAAPVNGYSHDAGRTTEKYELPSPGADTVLIVEDNEDLRDFMTSVLKHEFTILTAVDGEEGMEIAQRVVPSLILSDLMMPKMDGIQLTEKIKTDERTSHIPVVLLTAKNEVQSRLEGLRTGADDYLTKPFSTEELLVRIINLIEQRKRLAERFRERILVPPTLTEEDSLEEKFLVRVKNTVETHLGDFTFTVEKLAEEMNLSRTQLLRKLKALTGLSPNEFIKDLRLKKAADMIRQKADTITQIGYAVGFNDQSYFTKCFKKEYGVTPSDYTAQASEN